MRSRFQSPGAAAAAASRLSASVSAASLFSTILVLTLTQQVLCGCPSIIPRRRWGAAMSTAVHYITIPVADVIVGHTAGQACSTEAACARLVRNIQHQQQHDRDFADIAYGFLIGGHGLIFEGRGWHQQGAHTHGYNKKAIGVAFIGDFSETRASAAQMDALRGLLQCGVELGELSEAVRLYGQRQVHNTDSPGLALYQQLQDLPQWVEVP